ncbi:MAG: hypothetical protein WAV05_01010 [Anaerolineales bacterium]
MPGVGRFRRHGACGTGTTDTVVYNTVEEINRFGEAQQMIDNSDEHNN